MTVAVRQREYERRAAALQGLLAAERLDVLVLAANDYRGHKGSLRWIGGYNLVHRYGCAIVARNREPLLLIPENLAMAPGSEFGTPTRYVRRVADGLVEAVGEVGSVSRIGVVGLAQVMKVEDYLALREAYPEAEVIDVSDSFERVRACKSEDEIEGAREATTIAESCFARLLEITRPGITERLVGARMAERALELGGEDLLFLVMTAVPSGDDGTVTGQFAPPRDRVLQPGDMMIFSFELIGPRGYWMEFSRMVTLGEPSALQRRMNAAVDAGMTAAARAMRPGARPDVVQRAILDAVAAHGTRSAYWSGHGLGCDVIEEPWVGLETVQDRSAPQPWTLTAGMTLSMHPYVVDNDRRAIGYMADTFVVRDRGAEALSSVPRHIHVVGTATHRARATAVNGNTPDADRERAQRAISKLFGNVF